MSDWRRKYPGEKLPGMKPSKDRDSSDRKGMGWTAWEYTKIAWCWFWFTPIWLCVSIWKMLSAIWKWHIKKLRDSVCKCLYNSYEVVSESSTGEEEITEWIVLNKWGSLVGSIFYTLILSVIWTMVWISVMLGTGRVIESWNTLRTLFYGLLFSTAAEAFVRWAENSSWASRLFWPHEEDSLGNRRFGFYKVFSLVFLTISWALMVALAEEDTRKECQKLYEKIQKAKLTENRSNKSSPQADDHEEASKDKGSESPYPELSELNIKGNEKHCEIWREIKERWSNSEHVTLGSTLSWLIPHSPFTFCEWSPERHEVKDPIHLWHPGVIWTIIFCLWMRGVIYYRPSKFSYDAYYDRFVEDELHFRRADAEPDVETKLREVAELREKQKQEQTPPK